MGIVQEDDMESSVQTPLKENHLISSPRSEKSDPNQGQETTTPSTAQRPLVSHELGSSNYESLHPNNAPPHITNGEEEEESNNNNASSRPSTEADRSGDSISSPSESVENEHLIPGNSKKKKGYIPQNVVLYRAALKGDWKTAKFIFDMDPSAITKKLTERKDTVLHIAAAAKHISFVEKLVKLSSSSDLATKNNNEYTALAYAAGSGVVRIAKAMVDKNPDLSNLEDALKRTPVVLAVGYKRREMASYLYSNTNFEALETFQQFHLLLATIRSDYYDITLDILKRKPELAAVRINEDGDTALHLLARKPSAIGSSSKLSFWKTHINSRFNGIYKTALMQTLAHQAVEHLWNFIVKDLSTHELYHFIRTPSSLLHDAARVGNVEFLIILIRSYPDLIWTVDGDNNKTIFHVAVENRQENVFSLIYEIGGLKDFLANFYDEGNNSNILHLAGRVASPNHLSRVSGAALQMQRELLWFKEVEKFVIPTHHEMRCDPLPELSTIEIRRDHDDKLTPRELFTKAHKNLLKDGEEWMKNTANSCMLVATLIATVVFAAAFTIPGGNDDKDGIPIFQQNQAFTVFVVSDVAALVMSITSILIFLSILTSRYAEEDFLISLPRKLLFGLVTLFVSIACMVVAYSATFFIVYDKAKAKIPLIIAVVTILPIACFCVFHFKLVVDILRSIYWPQFSLRKRRKRL